MTSTKNVVVAPSRTQKNYQLENFNGPENYESEKESPLRYNSYKGSVADIIYNPPKSSVKQIARKQTLTISKSSAHVDRNNQEIEKD